MQAPSSVASGTISIFDARPFFEKALIFGVANGIIPRQKLDIICADAPKGMVQIARYFGNENLRPELELAKNRMVNLVSLYLENTTGGDLQQAAQQVRYHSFLSLSKGGSDMLKALIAMPQSSHFGMNELARHTGFSDNHIALLAKWSLRSLPDYQAELAKRSQVTQVVDAAIWLAEALGVGVDELEEAGKDAEAVIRTALLALACKRTEMPDRAAFEKIVAALRKKTATNANASALPLQNGFPKGLPKHLHTVVDAVHQSVLTDLPKILDAAVPARKLFDQNPAFMGRYFWLEDGLSEVDDYDRATSAAWSKVTKGHNDDGSLLTLFLCIAAGSTPTTLLTEKTAATLIRKMRKNGLQAQAAIDYILTHAPLQHQNDYVYMWSEFLEDAQPTLLSDMDYTLADALSLLRRECNIKQ
jgi:hypothetical protein